MNSPSLKMILSLVRLTLAAGLLTGCTSSVAPTPGPQPPASAAIPTARPEPATTTAPTVATVTLEAALSAGQRAEALLALMTLDEKIGQMTQVEYNSITRADVTTFFVGSIISGGGPLSATNSPEEWRSWVDSYQERALQTRLGIPLIFGIDAIHGHGHVYGATLFPQNIGLGATRDADLVERIGRATAEELAATDIRWNFAPVVAVPQDIRWGRTYESYSEDTDVTAMLGAAYVRGLQAVNGQLDLSDPATVLATPKHYLGDGGTLFGTSTTVIQHPYLLDQGDMRVDEATVRALFLPPYQAALQAGAQSIMVSFSSWRGIKMHAQKHLLTEVLKGELGFTGFLVSDWQAIDQIPGDYYFDVVTSINAGLDMIMVPYDYRAFITSLKQAVEKGDVPMERIDDAVRRILTVKFAMGLFEHPYPSQVKDLAASVGSAAHRELAREAVRKSLVLLKNDQQTLPLSKDTPLIFVVGEAADDLGIQAGGWTIDWQGAYGRITLGTTILQGVQQAVGPEARVEYNAQGRLQSFKDAQGNPEIADIGIAVVGEGPYAEGVGDREDLTLSATDQSLISNLRERSKRLVVIVVAGRPLVVTEMLPKIDALVAAWLPGTEGAGVAEVLFGDFAFTGKLPYSWPRWNQQLPFDFRDLPVEGCDAPLFPFGYGLDTASPSPVIPACPTP